MKLKVISIGTTPMTKKINSLLEKMECVEFAGVVNLNPEKYSHRSNFEPMYDFRLRRPLDIYYTDDINSPDTIKWISDRAPDIILQSGWSQIWKSEILSVPKMFCVGVHAAPLPNGRGAAILNWKLIEGGGPWGNSLFVMEEKTDLGDVLDFEPFDLEERDDVRSAYLKADRTALKMVERTLPKLLDGSYKRVSQKDKKGTRYYKRTPEDGRMDIEWESSKLNNFVRALTHPYPGAFFETKFGNVIVWSSEVDVRPSEKAPGTVLEIKKGKGILIKTGEISALWLKAIQPENDVEVWADTWAGELNIKTEEKIIT